jgi:hypothetical protein
MKSYLIRKDPKTGEEFGLAIFVAPGDALWAATVFQAHKIYGDRFQHFVRTGKIIEYPVEAIDPAIFNLIGRDK